MSPFYIESHFLFNLRDPFHLDELSLYLEFNFNYVFYPSPLMKDESINDLLLLIWLAMTQICWIQATILTPMKML